MATSENGKDAFDRLAGAMPKIAEALKALPETVHERAFEELLAAAKGQSSPSTATQTQQTPKRRAGTRRKAATDGPKKARKRAAGGGSLVKDLDLTPKGKKSFKDFVAEKDPKGHHDRSTVSVYYLAEILKINPITVAHLFTCYRSAGWPLPADMNNSLRVTASQKGYLDTSNTQDISLTSIGTNRIEHELPATKA